MTVKDDEDDEQDCGSCRRMLSCTGNPEPLLSNVCVLPSAVETTTLNDVIDVLVEIFAEKLKNAKPSSRPAPVPADLVVIVVLAPFRSFATRLTDDTVLDVVLTRMSPEKVALDPLASFKYSCRPYGLTSYGVNALVERVTEPGTVSIIRCRRDWHVLWKNAGSAMAVMVLLLSLVLTLKSELRLYWTERPLTNGSLVVPTTYSEAIFSSNEDGLVSIDTKSFGALFGATIKGLFAP